MTQIFLRLVCQECGSTLDAERCPEKDGDPCCPSDDPAYEVEPCRGCIEKRPLPYDDRIERIQDIINGIS